MHLHSNAATTRTMRQRIQGAPGSLREIGRRFGVSATTVRRWRSRDSCEDRSSRPKQCRTAFEPETEPRLLDLRRRGLSLDEVFESLMDEMPRLCRCSLWRLFRRHGLARVRRNAPKTHSSFKPYAPGYVHIDSFCTPRFGSARYYGFVAVDRATRRTCVAVYPDKTQESGADFLERCIQEFEFRIVKVLTDNGSEFTNRTYKGGRAKREHAFERLCQSQGIEHRRTRPRTPKTNGLAERQVAIVKNATTRAKTYISPEAMKADLLEWNHKSNRKRQRRLAYKTPLQVSQEWYHSHKTLFTREPIPKGPGA